jgi:predicted ATPase
MLRFLRRIRETDEGNLPPGKDPLRPDQLAVYYVEQGKTGVSVSPIRISEDGEFIDSWPKGFFEEREEELLY